MRVYFVRHGESEANASGVRQGSDGHLSDKGREQARMIGERFKKTPIDIIISSTQNRAKETTAELLTIIDKKVSYSDLFVERKNPTEMIGQHWESDETQSMLASIFEHYDQKEWHHSDEENFFDLVARADKAIAYINELKARDVLIVTHGFFVRVIVARLIFEETLTPQIFFKWLEATQMPNIGVVVCEEILRPNSKLLPMRSGWRLESWNS
ncbi:hypothetical protein COB55_01610 [Candidatus Wolfebacteria bacterium]|nr:MAG: hypothetical protein COB55_01610 [Candidatus Wolfebacteria bacterium]